MPVVGDAGESLFSLPTFSVQRCTSCAVLLAALLLFLLPCCCTRLRKLALLVVGDCGRDAPSPQHAQLIESHRLPPHVDNRKMWHSTVL